MVKNKFKIKKKLSLIFVVGILFLFLVNSFVLAEENFTSEQIDEESSKVINDSVDIDIPLEVINETELPKLDETLIDSSNETFDLNETDDEVINVTIPNNETSGIGESLENLTEELNETIELNETNRTVFEVFSFNLFSVANSTGYGLNLFALGLQAGKILFNGNYFT